MKTMLSPRRQHHAARVCILLVAVALIVGMVGCAHHAQYVLTIASTPGGSVTAPGEGAFDCNEGTVVSLVAEAEQGYSCVSWTGDVSTIADVSEATTNITMNGDYSITASFALAILDWYDLDAIRINSSSSYVLLSDLDSTTAGYTEMAGPSANGGKGWEPIGSEDPSASFTGTFDGRGYEIRDLFIDRPHEDYVGLFGFVDKGGVIQDIGVVNIVAVGNAYVGGLVGTNMYGNVTNSYSTGNVTGAYSVGGLVGASNGTVIDSYSAASVIGEGEVGGLAGTNEDNGTVVNCYSAGSVTGTEEVGGLVGDNAGGTVTNSFWDIETSAQSTSAGGTGQTTAEMQDITTFSGATWDIVTVVDPATRDRSHIWNIVDGQTYPFLSWQPIP
jgi:hypothetical protein